MSNYKDKDKHNNADNQLFKAIKASYRSPLLL